VPFQLQVKLDFDSAHNHPGEYEQCRRLHGHTWLVEVAVESYDLDQYGMVCDFKTLKTLVREVTDKLDHRYLNEIPPFDAISPTAENIARHIYREVASRLGFPGVVLAYVRVCESPTSCAVYWESRRPEP
jgi:6-pyruvoyltetrahydropterin/6-carboxytetrahydropterin synthase